MLRTPPLIRNVVYVYKGSSIKLHAQQGFQPCQELQCVVATQAEVLKNFQVLSVEGTFRNP